MVNLSLTCELFVDGYRVPDCAEDFEAGAATALEPLTVTWGRDSILDQPDTGVCSFTIRDPAPTSPPPAATQIAQQTFTWETLHTAADPFVGGMWKLQADGAVSFDTARYHSAPQSLHITGTGHGQQIGASLLRSITQGIVAGAALIARAWVYAPASSSRDPELFVGAGANVGQVPLGSATSSQRDAWVLLEVPFTVPTSDSAGITVLFFADSYPAGGPGHWLDDFSIVDASSGATIYSWAFDGSFDGWAATSHVIAPWSTVNGGTATPSTVRYHSDPRSVLIGGTPTAGYTTGLAWQFGDQVAPGGRYRVGGWMYAPSDSPSDAGLLVLIDGTGIGPSIYTPVRDEWVWVECTFTASQSAGSIESHEVVFWGESAAGGPGHWLDDATVVDDSLAGRALDYLRVGAEVEVWAETLGTFPAGTEFIDDGSFITGEVGQPTWPRLGAGYGYHWIDGAPGSGQGGAGLATIIAAAVPQLAYGADDTGNVYAVLAPVHYPGNTTAGYPFTDSLLIPPTAWAADATEVDAWDQWPQAGGIGGATSVTVRFRYRTLPGVPVGVHLRLTEQPWPTATHYLAGPDMAATPAPSRDWTDFERTFTWGGGAYWPIIEIRIRGDGVTPFDDNISWEFAGTATADTWETTGDLTWYEYGGISIDDVSLAYTDPADIPDRRLVFSGEITDVVIAPAAGPATSQAIDVAITAADLGSQLANDVIGDEPWPAEPLASRVNRITAASGQTLPVLIDAGLRDVEVSWRDVDAQPVLGLLQDLAQTVGGVLWATGHRISGPYLWIEDQITAREAARRWAWTAGTATIVGAGDAFLPLSACDVVRDPVTWEQAVSDVVTAIDVTWEDQTVDEDGNPATTDETFSITDADAVTRYGTNRLSVSTELTSVEAAEEIAERFFAIARGTGWRTAGVTVDTGNLPGDEATGELARRATFMRILDQVARCGLAILITDLPTYSPIGQETPVFLDGGTYTFQGGAWELDLTLTPTEGLGAGATWADLAGFPATWQQVDVSVTWLDAIGVAGPEPTTLALNDQEAA